MKKLSLSFLALLVVLLGTCFVGCKKDVNFVDTPGLVNSDGNSSGVDADSATITKDGNSSGVDADSATITKDGNSSGVDADSTTVTKDGTEYSISLESVAAGHKIAVIKAVREITGLELKAAKELVEGAPKVLKKGISKEEADKIKQEIEAAGGVVNIYTSVQGNL